MRTTLIAGQSVSHEIQECWLRLQTKNLELQGPYFSPIFTQIVAASRADIEVAVIEEGAEIVAIFPFERRPWNFGCPVGSFISDYHGVISQKQFVFDPLELLRQCGLVAWDFNHLPLSQGSFAPFYREQHRSPIIDLSNGYEAYVSERRAAGSEQIKKANNLMRRLEREVGPLQFVAHSSDRGLLDNLIASKTLQFKRNGWRDLFSIPWVDQVIRTIHATQTPNFAGVFSALYAGNRLVAAHFGMRSATVWHYWFPTYDDAFARYSPGVILLLKMAESATGLGIHTLDLGCGEHSYKSRLMNGFIPTAQGSVELTCPPTLARRFWEPVSGLPSKARRVVGKTPIGALARRLLERTR